MSKRNIGFRTFPRSNFLLKMWLANDLRASLVQYFEIFILNNTQNFCLFDTYKPAKLAASLNSQALEK